MSICESAQSLCLVIHSRQYTVCWESGLRVCYPQGQDGTIERELTRYVHAELAMAGSGDAA